MSTFVLVHGAFQGAWCWYKVVVRLEAAGHRVVALDLPGHGRDATPRKSLNAHDYADAVESALESLGEPVILVGHSLGGVTVSLAAERCAEKVAAVVYVGAAIVESGHSVMSSPPVSDMVQQFTEAAFDEADNTVAMPHELIRQIFYRSCEANDYALGTMMLVPEPVEAFQTPVALSAERYGAVPKYGITLVHDHFFPIAMQEQMYHGGNLVTSVSMDTDHSPFFCAPDELTGHLIAFAADAASRRQVTEGDR